ncbi:hypothetical protein RRF57_001550 [Xylaria bambusicola]|uniref:Uncharacterized protein n=1 Tax=Xylaria bambusicola TaxID=326684 RepID=A0AAN7UR02_9PEZI
MRRRSITQVEYGHANHILAQRLREGRWMVYRCIHEFSNVRGIRTRDVPFNVEYFNYYVWRFDQYTHKIKSLGRYYMGLCITQILLNIVWSRPCHSNPTRMSMQILSFMRQYEKRKMAWLEARNGLKQCIDAIQRSYNLSEYSLRSKGAEGQQPGDLENKRSLLRAPRAQLRRARAILRASDASFLASMFMLSFRVLTRLTDDILTVIGTLESVNSRLWLKEHLTTAWEYLSSLYTETSLITGSRTTSRNNDDYMNQLESVMKLYDLYRTMDKIRSD